MQTIIKEFLGVFSSVFPNTYKEALIESIKEGTFPEDEDERQLPEVPTPEDPLMEGSVTKECAFRKNFKVNHLVAMNKADNYRIDYFDKEGGSLKGSINCAGYKTEKIAEDNGIDVIPSDDSRRTYKLRFESVDMRDEWLEIVNNACKKAKAPDNPDKLLAKAFNGAYRAVRWHYGYYGRFKMYFTESEQLAELCLKVLYRDLIQDVIDNIPDGPLRNMTEKGVRNMVDATVTGAVSSAWSSASEACKGSRATLEGAVTDLLTPLFEQEVTLKESIAEKTGEKVNPFLEDVGGRVCEPVLDVCVSSITEAYVSAAQGMQAFLKKQIDDGEFNGDAAKVAKAIKKCHRAVDKNHHGPLEESYKICWELYSSKLKTLDKLFDGDFSTYDVYSNTMDEIRDLSHRAVHAIATGISKFEGDEKDFNGLLKDVMTKYMHDTKLSMKDVLNGILGGMLASPVETGVLTPALTLVAPVQEVIDAIPVPGLADLFSLEALTEDVVGRGVDDAVGTLVDASFGKVESTLDEEGAKFTE